MTQSKVLISGASGQIGSLLAEIYVSKGWEVHGFVRQRSDLSFLSKVKDSVYLHLQDIRDPHGVWATISDLKPDVIHHCAAMTYVPYSWANPLDTFATNVDATINILQSVKEDSPDTVLHFCGSSEEYGSVSPEDTPIVEDTTPKPASPYGVSKQAADLLCQQFHRSFGTKTVITRAFNHECVTAETPVTIFRNGLIDILPISEVVPHRTNPRHGGKYTTKGVDMRQSFSVWDSRGWSLVTCATATWNRPGLKSVRRISSRASVYTTTDDHEVFSLGDTGERGEEGIAATIRQCKAGNLKVGEALALIGLPSANEVIKLTEEEAWLLGFIVAEGYITPDGKITLSNQDNLLLDFAERMWRTVSGGGASRHDYPSGFKNGKDVTQLRLTSANNYGRWIRDSIYTKSGEKRVPIRVLNSPAESRLAFLRGYNAGDGLKAGHGDYKFKSFKTSSATLAASLYWLTSTTLPSQRAIICLEERDASQYYQINLNSPRLDRSRWGSHFEKPLEEVVKITASVAHTGWLFDLATTTGTFSAGVGRGWIHNSPRRGEQFVSTQVVRQAAEIVRGKREAYSLGNLTSVRDYSDARDIADAYFIAANSGKVNYGEPYNVCTGIGTTVKELVTMMNVIADMQIGSKTSARGAITQDPARMRPSDIPVMVGDSTKFRKATGWVPKHTLEDTLRWMWSEEMMK